MRYSFPFLFSYLHHILEIKRKDKNILTFYLIASSIMERTHFPGYGRCVTCEEIVSEKEVHNHILNCRKKSFNEKQLCNFCNKQIHSKEFQQHIQTCNQQTISSKSTLSSKKQCPLCQKLVEDLPSHCLICQNDENGYQTPRAQTPVKLFILFILFIFLLLFID
jgi:hypothetical protein